jgi:hypothetical protein
MDPRPEPVTLAGKVAGAVGGIVTFLAALGLISTAEGDTLSTAATGLLALALAVPGVVAPVVAAYRARRKVTPLSDPQNNAGQPLTPSAPDVPGLR